LVLEVREVGQIPVSNLFLSYEMELLSVEIVLEVLNFGMLTKELYYKRLHITRGDLSFQTKGKGILWRVTHQS